MSSNQPSVGAALEYAKKTLGGPLVENESVVSVDVTPVTIAKGNGDRVALVIVNLGPVNVFVVMTGTPSAARGIQLAANGGNMSMTVIYDFTLPTREFNAAASAGGPANVYVLELSRFTLL